MRSKEAFWQNIAHRDTHNVVQPLHRPLSSAALISLASEAGQHTFGLHTPTVTQTHCTPTVHTLLQIHTSEWSHGLILAPEITFPLKTLVQICLQIVFKYTKSNRFALKTT